MTTAKEDIIKHRKRLGLTYKEIEALTGYTSVKNWFQPGYKIKADPYNAIMAITSEQIEEWRMKQ